MNMDDTIFVDHNSAYINAYYRVYLGGIDTGLSKKLHERQANECGVSAKSYRSDNGVYKCQSFIDDVEKQQYAFNLSGVDAHCQNEVAEQSTETTVNSSRTILLHQALL